ncbi:MAG: hypothetical protein KDK96_07495 [Chlamydiia bacterium]|nr:hypothetical protein [Chlamydiia bacterium]
MNKIKIGILTLITAISTTFAAEVEQSTPYFSVEGGFPTVLNLNLGYRLQKDHNGLDVGIGASPIVLFNLSAYGYVNYLYYLNPNPYSQYYIGVGSHIGYSVGSMLDYRYDNRWFAKPQLLIGKEFQINAREKHFIQLAAGNYFVFSGSPKYVPSLTLSYGFTY